LIGVAGTTFGAIKKINTSNGVFTKLNTSQPIRPLPLNKSKLNKKINVLENQKNVEVKNIPDPQN
jgi:hypothetical protein